MIHDIIPLLGSLDFYMNYRSAICRESLAGVGVGLIYERIAEKIEGRTRMDPALII